MPFLAEAGQAGALPIAAAALAAFAAVLIAAIALWLGLRLGRRAGRAEAERAMAKSEAAAREDAVRRSRSVLTGQIGEQLAPFLPGFPCDPADARFVGKPVDFVAFPGASDGSPREVLLIEVKTGDAKLSAPERAIRDAVESGRVRWVEYRPEVGMPAGDRLAKPAREPVGGRKPRS